MQKFYSGRTQAQLGAMRDIAFCRKMVNRFVRTRIGAKTSNGSETYWSFEEELEHISLENLPEYMLGQIEGFMKRRILAGVKYTPELAQQKHTELKVKIDENLATPVRGTLFDIIRENQNMLLVGFAAYEVVLDVTNVFVDLHPVNLDGHTFVNASECENDAVGEYGYRTIYAVWRLEDNSISFYQRAIHDDKILLFITKTRH